MLFAACSTLAPEYHKPQEPLPVAYSGAASKTEPSATLPAPDSKWWEEFGSPELNSLVERALANNHDLKAAVSRVAQANTNIAYARGDYYPSLSANYSDSLVYPDAGVGIPERLGVKAESLRTHTLDAQIGYQLDLWGKTNSSVDEALAHAESSEYDRQAVALNLVSDVVQQYLDYLQNRDLSTLSHHSYDNSREQVRSIQLLLQAHESNLIELAHEKTQMVIAETAFREYDAVAENDRIQLATLLAVPVGDLDLKGQSLSDLEIPSVALGVPSELLQRRPDIRSAEAELRAANAGIGSARALYYPQILLTADVGRGANYLGDLLLPSSLYYNLIGSVTQSIFNGGKTDAAVEYSKAKFDEAAETYRQSIIRAFNEVEEGLLRLDNISAQIQAAESAVTYADEAASLSTVAYQARSLDYTSLLDAQRTLYTTQDTLIRLKLTRLVYVNGLFQSLGGDVAPAKKPGTATTEATAPAAKP